MQIIEKNSEEDFLDSMYVISHSKRTTASYQSAINHLKSFLQQRYNYDVDQLIIKLNSEELDLYKILRELIVYLDQKGIKPKGIRSYLSGIKGYLRHLGIRINSDDFKQFVKIPKQIRTREVPLTKEIIIRVINTANGKLRTAIIVATASGMRIGELVSLHLEDVDFSSNPTRITIRGDSAKGKLSRETFLTTEATNALKDYLKHNFDWKEDNSNESLKSIRIFGRTSKIKNLNSSAKFNSETAKNVLQSSLIKHIAKIPELEIRNENGFRAIHFHAFRKFFRTTVGNAVGRDYAEALMGHGFYMDTYYQLPDDKKRQMYLDAEPHLTLSDFEKIEKNFKVLSAKHTELEDKVDDLMQYLRKNSIEVPDLLVKT